MKKALWCFIGLSLIVAACASAAPEPTFAVPQGRLIPPIIPPPNSQPLGGGGGGSPVEEGASIEFISAMTVAEIHKYYAIQLEASGWRYVTDGQTSEGRITFWELVDDEGSSWAAKLEVMEVPDAIDEDTFRVNVALVLPR